MPPFISIDRHSRVVGVIDERQFAAEAFLKASHAKKLASAEGRLP